MSTAFRTCAVIKYTQDNCLFITYYTNEKRIKLNEYSINTIHINPIYEQSGSKNSYTHTHTHDENVYDHDFGLCFTMLCLWPPNSCHSKFTFSIQIA